MRGTDPGFGSEPGVAAASPRREIVAEGAPRDVTCETLVHRAGVKGGVRGLSLEDGVADGGMVRLGWRLDVNGLRELAGIS